MRTCLIFRSMLNTRQNGLAFESLLEYWKFGNQYVLRCALLLFFSGLKWHISVTQSPKYTPDWSTWPLSTLKRGTTFRRASGSSVPTVTSMGWQHTIFSGQYLDHHWMSVFQNDKQVNVLFSKESIIWRSIIKILFNHFTSRKML